MQSRELLLVQMHIGKIEMWALLSERQVPDVASSICPCGDDRDTVVHMAAYCLQEEGARHELPFAMRISRGFDAAGKSPAKVTNLIWWFARRPRRPFGERVAL
jgi:hypothetical protein